MNSHLVETRNLMEDEIVKLNQISNSMCKIYNYIIYIRYLSIFI